MRITFLGTGTSSGVPVLTCECNVCSSADFRDQRLRVSVLLETQNKHIVIDTGPDFRQQALNVNLKQLDAVLFTHEHKDHTGGLDDIRPFNYMNGPKVLDIYGQKRVIEQLKSEYYYAFSAEKYPGSPLLETHHIDQAVFSIQGVEIKTINVRHHLLEILGFRIGDFTYITDANHISEAEIEKCKGSKVLVLNALQHTPHISHFTLEEAIVVAQKINAEKTYFTHIGHKMGLHREVEQTLPANMFLAFDGLHFEI
jgi:phosphoribosyl 1,2-cyclic phosphate phosphodiesterase